MNIKSSTPFPTAALIDGQWVTSEKTFAVLDPATGEKLADVPDLSPADAKRAIDAAHKAFPAWAAKPAKDRAVILRRWFDLIIAETEGLAARLPTARPSSSGSRKKESAPTATRSRRRPPHAATSRSSSRSASARRSRRGTSRLR